MLCEPGDHQGSGCLWVREVIGSEFGREQRHSKQPASDLEVLWVGMWKDLYCYALRINMVLPDWRGIIGLGLYHVHVARVRSI